MTLSNNPLHLNLALVCVCVCLTVLYVRQGQGDQGDNGVARGLLRFDRATAAAAAEPGHRLMMKRGDSRRSGRDAHHM